MRTLTRDEIVSETLHRLTLRRGRNTTRLDRELVELVAEIVELSRERVPDCYTQATMTPPTRPARPVRPPCDECDGAGYVLAHPLESSYPYDVACPSCQGRQRD